MRGECARELKTSTPTTRSNSQAKITWYSTVKINICYIHIGQSTTSKPKVAAAKHQQPASQIAVHPALRRPTIDRVPTPWRIDNTPCLELHHQIHIRTIARTIASNALDEEAERPQDALKFGSTGTMSNINIRTATVISPHRRLPRNLTQSLIILISQGRSTHFRLISQRTRQIQGRRKLRKCRKYVP
jgi:hypothetical protein